MKGRPWYKRYPADILHGTMALSVAEKGAYNVILDLMYDRGGPIPDDEKWLARQCGCSMQQWRTLRASLIGYGKIAVTPDGRLSNDRAILEMAKNEGEAKALSAAGRRGGLARKPTKSDENTPENEPKTRVINDVAEKRLEATQPTVDCASGTEKLEISSRFVGDNSDLFGCVSAENNTLAEKGLEAVPEARVYKGRKKESSLRSDSCPPLPVAHRIPDDWRPSNSDNNYAIAHNVDPVRATEDMLNYWPNVQGKAALKSDWGKTFRNSVLRLQDKGMFALDAPGCRPRDPPPSKRMAAFNLLRVYRQGNDSDE